MHWFGIIIGWVIVAGYLFGAGNYAVKLANRRLIVRLPLNSPWRRHFSLFMRIIVKGHIYVAMYLVTIFLLHFMIELIHEGFFVTGLIAAALMIAQMAIGAYGAIVRGKRHGPWLLAHRTNAVLLLVAIAAHIIAVIGLHAD